MQTVSRRCFLSAFRQCVATIYTNVKDFEVFIPESATWISKVDLRQDFAAGRVDVYVTLTDNLDSDYERNSSIRISSETNEKIFCDVDIRQSPYDGYVEISDWGGEVAEFYSPLANRYRLCSIRTNLPSDKISIISEPESKWAEIEIYSDNNVYMYLRENTESEMRVTEFFVYPSDLDPIFTSNFFVFDNGFYIKVAQEGVSIKIGDSNRQYIYFDAENPEPKTVGRLNTNIYDYSIEIPEDAEWITQVEIDKSNNDIVVYADSNSEQVDRIATVKIVSDANPDIYAEIIVKHYAFKPFLSFDGYDSVTFDSEPFVGHSIGTLITNVPGFDVNIDYYGSERWLEVDIRPNNEVVVYSKTPNESSDYRIAYVTISLQQYPSESVVIKVAQLGMTEN